MRRIVAIVFSSLIAAAAAIVLANILVWTLIPEWMAIVPADRAKEFAVLCSRAAPGPIQGTWTPSIDDIRKVEQRLPALLESKLRDAGHHAPTTNPADYRRQYAGLIVGGRHIVYINGWFFKSPGSQDRSMFTLWGSVPVQPCDGGEAFFGVEFDVETFALANFRFNGAIEPQP